MGLISRVSSRTYRSQLIQQTNYDYPNRRSIENLANPLPRWCHDRQERHPINPRRHQSPKPLRHESSPIPQIQGTRQGKLHLATLPLGLTDEGITYLREQLSLPENVMPNTLKRTQEPQARPDRRPNKVGEGRPVYGNRDGYRRNQDGGADKAGDAGAGNQAFQYKGGYGRGKPANME